MKWLTVYLMKRRLSAAVLELHISERDGDTMLTRGYRQQVYTYAAAILFLEAESNT